MVSGDGYARGEKDNMKNTTLLIMAAGIGSRFGGGIKQLERKRQIVSTFLNSSYVR